MILFNFLLFLVTFQQSKGTAAKLPTGCTFELKFVSVDPPIVKCSQTCDVDVSEVQNDTSGPQKFYFRNDEIENIFNKVVEIHINEDRSLDCKLVDSSEDLDLKNSFELKVIMLYQSPIFPEEENAKNECGDENYEYVKESDWCVKISSKRQRWNKVQLACASEGGTFAVIDTKAKDEAMRELLRRRNVMGAWIGLSDTKAEGTFEWIDGTPLSHTSWFEGQRDETSEEEDCVHYFKPYGYLWNVHNCNSFFHYICEKKKTFPVTAYLPAMNVGIAACPTGWLRSSVSDECYHVGGKAHNFYHSEAYCHDRGGSLITIRNREEMSFIADMLIQSSIEKVWIGLSDAAVEDDFLWVDGSPLTYVSWNSEQPDNEGGDEDCVAADSSHNFQWSDVSCDEFLRPLCMRKSEILPIFIKGCSSGCVIVQTLRELNEWEQNCPIQNTGSLVCVPKPNRAGYTNYKPLFVICMVCCIVMVLFIFYVFRCFVDLDKEKFENTLERSGAEYDQEVNVFNIGKKG